MTHLHVFWVPCCPHASHYTVPVIRALLLSRPHYGLRSGEVQGHPPAQQTHRLPPPPPTSAGRTSQMPSRSLPKMLPSTPYGSTAVRPPAVAAVLITLAADDRAAAALPGLLPPPPPPSPPYALLPLCAGTEGLCRSLDRSAQP